MFKYLSGREKSLGNDRRNDRRYNHRNINGGKEVELMENPMRNPLKRQHNGIYYDSIHF